MTTFGRLSVTARPIKIRVGPHNYSVLWSQKQWQDHLTKTQIKEACGYTRALTTQIFVKGWELSITQQKETLVHELFHAVFNLTNFEFQEHKKIKDTEEHIVLMVSPWWAMIIKENPDLLAWLTSD